ncbi:MAG TPA: DUF6776 family protein [Burkholderiales bacterium]|nr:DUF6776 family protein [Burkholderiales bacterium]
MKRKFGISAPRVAVQSQVAWYWRWLAIAAAVGLVVAIALLAYDLGRRNAGFDRSAAQREQARLQELNGDLEEENNSLRRQIAAIDRQLQIELSTQGNLSGQIQVLSEENALLKEDLAFFQTLMASGGEPGGITINRFRVQPDALPGEYRYRLLIVQSRQRVREFRGRLQFVVDMEEGGKPTVVTIPAENDNTQVYNLSFKFYQRVDGTFMLPPSAVVKRVQVRVLENGNPTPLSTQSVTLS